MTRKVFLSEIVDAASRVFGVPADEIVGPRRQNLLMPARFAVYRLAVDLAGLTKANAADNLGRDHSTVIHGRRECLKRMRADPVYRAQVRHVRRLSKKGARIRQLDLILVTQRIERIRASTARKEAERREWLLSDESELDDLDLISARVAAHRASGGDFVEVRA